MINTRSQLRHSSSNFIGRRPKPIISSDYIVGLVDGEGCFYVGVPLPINKNGGARVQLAFFIKMREEDRGLLEKVRNALQCGAVYFQPETRPNHAQCYRYSVITHHEIFETIIPFFTKHPFQSETKKRSFAIFCQIANIVRNGLHRREEGLKKFIELKTQMNKKVIRQYKRQS